MLVQWCVGVVHKLTGCPSRGHAPYNVSDPVRHEGRRVSCNYYIHDKTLHELHSSFLISQTLGRTCELKK